MKIEGYDYGTREIVDTEIEPRLAWTKGEGEQGLYLADIDGYRINRFQGWNLWTPDGGFLGDLPTLRLAKIAAEMHARGISPHRHEPGHIQARVIGGGWGGWSRTYGTDSKCVTCGNLGGCSTTREARAHAWEHFESEAAKSLKEQA